MVSSGKVIHNEQNTAGGNISIRKIKVCLFVERIKFFNLSAITLTWNALGIFMVFIISMEMIVTRTKGHQQWRKAYVKFVGLLKDKMEEAKAQSDW